MTNTDIAELTTLMNECIPEIEQHFEWQFPAKPGDVGYLHNATDGYDYIFTVLELQVDETRDVNEELVTMFFTVDGMFNEAVFALDYAPKPQSSYTTFYSRIPQMDTLRVATVEDVVISVYSA